MNYLSIITAVIFTISFIQGIHILVLDHRVRTNRLFFGMTLCLSVWLFGAMFGYSSRTADEVWMWFRICSFGFIFLHAFTLHFCIELASFATLRPVFKFLIYAPSFIFLYISYTDKIVFRDFIKTADFWIGIPDFGSTVFRLFIFNYVGYYIISLVILAIWRKRTGSKREKSQAAIIIASILTTILLFNIEPFLLPLATQYKTIILSPDMSIIWMTGVWIAVKRYRFLSLTQEMVSMDIISSIDEYIFLLNDRLEVIFSNVKAERLTGSTPNNTSLVYGLDRMFYLSDAVGDSITKIFTGGDRCVSIRLKPKGEDKSYIDMKFSIIKDRFGDTLGLLAVGKDIGEIKHLKEIFRLTGREMEVIQFIMAGESNRIMASRLQISGKTLESHIRNIYNKLGINNKIQLFNIIRNFK